MGGLLPNLWTNRGGGTLMSGNFGKNINLSLFGESHGEGIGIVINGLKPGFELNLEQINEEMARRAPGKNDLSTARKESDKPEILSGLFEGKTTGAPLTMIIRNQDTRSRDYGKLKDVMRPGHADYTGYVKYKGFNDYRGGGHFSGRLTAPLVFAGAVAKQLLEAQGIKVGAHITQIGRIQDERFGVVNLQEEIFEHLLKEELPVLNTAKIEKMKKEILNAKQEGDSVGGKIECAIIGLPAGVGSPFFDSLESTIAHLAFSVPAVKGISFGDGYEFATMKGSVANDGYVMQEGNIKTATNHNGGITGGITNGMPVVFDVVIKPTPSISKVQQTINVATLEATTLQVEGRHDPCIVQRAVVVIEAIAAIGVLERLCD